MKDQYVPGRAFPTQLRYFDWLVTTPLLLVEFTALLRFKDKVGAMSRLVLWDIIMIISGYMGETIGFLVGGFQMRWVMFVLGCGGWLGVIVYLYTGIRQQADLADPETRRCIMLLTKFVTFGWLIYPAGFIVRAISPDCADACQLVYNVADAVNKVGFGIVIWAAGVAAAAEHSQNALDSHAAVAGAKSATVPTV
jgi:bacteriorhodopsin